VLHPRLVSRSFMRRLIPRTAPQIRFSVRSARAFAFLLRPLGYGGQDGLSTTLRSLGVGGLSAPLAGIRLPSATLRRCLPGVGLALCNATIFLIRLMRFQKLGSSRSVPTSVRAYPAHNHATHRTPLRLRLRGPMAADVGHLKNEDRNHTCSFVYRSSERNREGNQCRFRCEVCCFVERRTRSIPEHEVLGKKSVRVTPRTFVERNRHH